MIQFPWRIVLMHFVLALPLTATAQTTPPVASGEQLPLPGKPVVDGYGELSEHNREWVLTEPPQTQAEFLLGAAINHDHGATDLINKMVDDWHGELHFTQKFDDLD